jgi:hypothetical protein
MDRTETEQQTGKPALNDKCCLFCGFISLTPTRRKSLQLDFFVLPIIQLLQLFPSFKLVQNTFWMAYLGLIFFFRLKLLSGIKVEMLNSDLGLLCKKCWQKAALWS